MTPPRPSVLVTGSSGGIGSAACRKFLESGFQVFGVDIAEPTVSGEHFRHIHADVTSPAALDSAFEFAELPPIVHLVTVAGIAHSEEPAAHLAGTLISPVVFQASVGLNLVAHFNTMHAALPYLEQAEGDRSVTFVSSINALRGFGLPAYSAAKAGLGGLARSLTPFLGARGIRINVALPGTTPTPATLAEWADDREHFPRLAAKIPLGRLGAPEDIADFIMAITSLRHVTGQELVIDGGQSIAV